MKILDIFSFAFGNFFRRKARSALTVLGVVIGTAAVVIMLSIGIGMREGFKAQISQWSNVRAIQVFSKDDFGVEGESVSDEVGYLDDKGFEKVKNLPHVAAATPKMYQYYPILKNKKEGAQLQIMGISAAEMEAFDYEILYGRALNESDIGTNNFVMYYNTPFYFAKLKDEPQWWMEVAEGQELPFNPVDQKFSFIWNYEYGRGPVSGDAPKMKFHDGVCVGIIAQKKGGDYDSGVIMDVKGLIQLTKELEKEREEYNKSQKTDDDYSNYVDDMFTYSGMNSGSGNSGGRKNIYSEFYVLCDKTDNVQELEKAIRELGYETYSSMSYLTEMEKQTAFLTTILGAIGAVSFLVAAISIANTMIMSIYERTREIGIMKVLGCKLGNIRTMFLVEAAIIGFSGGVLGIGLSYGLSYIVNMLAASNDEMLGFSGLGVNISIIPFWLNIVALGLATAVGIISGLYPAFRATRLSALEAIKNE